MPVARGITKSLNLQDYSLITGIGLEPLRHSRVLERVDLNIGGSTGNEDINEPRVF